MIHVALEGRVRINPRHRLVEQAVQTWRLLHSLNQTKLGERTQRRIQQADVVNHFDLCVSFFQRLLHGVRSLVMPGTKGRGHQQNATHWSRPLKSSTSLILNLIFLADNSNSRRQRNGKAQIKEKAESIRSTSLRLSYSVDNPSSQPI